MANERILVVEDDPAVSGLIARYLERCGYQVAACAATGEDALLQAGRTQPNLALMDIELGSALDGVQTAERLRARFDVPVVFLTGLSDDATIKRCQDAKAFGYLLKPFRPDDLKTSIDLALSKHEVESKLRSIERWFAAAIKSIGEAVITVDDEARVTFLNPVAEALTGWSLAEAQGRPLEQIFRAESDKTSGSNGDATASADIAGTTAATTPSRPMWLTGREERIIPIECSAAPIRNESGAVIGRVLVFRDITKRRQAEEALRRSREESRLLAAHVERVREEERKHLAREVHDELGQKITGLRMDLAWLDKRLPAIADAAMRDPLAVKVKSMFGLLDEMVFSVRRISAELRPGVLDDLGLPAALEWRARDWQARSGIVCHVTADVGETAVSPECATALFRIFQEALTNVARHARATRVDANLHAADGWLVMEITDNGRGITDAERRGGNSFGLLGMSERAARLGGTFEIQGTGEGTTLRVKLPPAGEPTS